MTVDLNTMEAAGEIILKSLQEWYCSKSNRPDKSRIIALGASLGQLETIKGKKGLCIIRDVGIFSKRGYGTDLVHFDGVHARD